MQARPGTLECGWFNKDNKKPHCRRFAVDFAVGKEFRDQPLHLSFLNSSYESGRPDADRFAGSEGRSPRENLC